MTSDQACFKAEGAGDAGSRAACRWCCCSACSHGACSRCSTRAEDEPPPRGDARAGAEPGDANPPRLLDDARTPSAAASPERASRFAVDLACADSVQLKFVRKPRAGLLFDVRTGRVLWRRNPERRLPIASLTKMMTALLIVEREDPHDRVRITRRATRTPGSAIGVLPKGKKVQLEALLNGLLLVSGNDAAVALAQHSGGTRARLRAR